MALHCDYWTLMAQPVRFLELFEMYLWAKNKVEQEESEKQKSKLSRLKGKRGR